MGLFETLERKQKLTFFDGGAENRYFLARARILSTTMNFKTYARVSKPFDIIRANIILRAMENKRTIDQAYREAMRLHRHDEELTEEEKQEIIDAVEEAKKDLPYLQLGEERIFVPILPRSLNAIYDNNILALQEGPFKVLLGDRYEPLTIDPFDAYGYRLYDSYFTNLILVKAVGETAAFFDYDSLTIYFIGNQGRLDGSIALFDRRIGKRNTNHMMERIVPVVDAFFRDDRDGLMQTLVEKQLISSSLIYKIQSDERKAQARLEKTFLR